MRWFKNIGKDITEFPDCVDSAVFQKRWAAVKQSNKEWPAQYVESTLGLKVSTKELFDVQIKVRFELCWRRCVEGC